MRQEYTWISRCLVKQSDINGITHRYTIQIACNANDDVDLHRRLRDLAANQDFVIEAIEYSRLIQDHLDKLDYYDHESIQLASQSAQHGYALGQLTATNDTSSGINHDHPSLLNIDEYPVTHKKDPTKPSWQQPWIDPAVKKVIFDHSLNAQLKTYLLIDATSRNAITSTFDLGEYDDLPIQSLYSGALAQELKQQAPYLLDVTLNAQQLSNNEDVPRFHRDFFSKHWGQHTGIFFHSSEPMDKLARHLKKFIKIRNNEGQWFYFRFFDPRTMNHYLQSIQRWPQRIAKWYGAQQGTELIKAILCEDQSGSLLKRYQLIPDHTLNHGGQIELTETEFQFFQDYRWQHNKQLIETELKNDFPLETQQMSHQQFSLWCDEGKHKGYTTPRALYDYCYSALMAQTHNFDLSEIEHYLSEQTTSHLEKSKLLYQSTKDAVERYTSGSTR
ncbi:DUF4123 domain-containing protein [Kangiella marina]|uniref:DUF4123 domain-containing protein n=1 Tax=Kangiella marina TaxID=1079178 RepID=A0ABP8IIZ8_9GAMM